MAITADKSRILVVDSLTSRRKKIVERLCNAPLQYVVEETKSLQELEALLNDAKRVPELILSACHLSDGDALDLLSRFYGCATLVICDNPSTAHVTEIFRAGAYDVIIDDQSSDLLPDLSLRVENAIIRRLKKSDNYLGTVEQILRNRTDQVEETYGFFEAVFRQSNIGIFAFDVFDAIDYRVSMFNKTYQDWTGLNGDALRGCSLRDLANQLSPETLIYFQQLFDACRHTGDTLESEAQLRFGDKTEWWLHKVTPVFDAQKRVCRVIGSALIISPRKRVEEALRKSTDKLQSIVDNIGVGIAVIDRASKIWEANPQMRHWFPELSQDPRPSWEFIFQDKKLDAVFQGAPMPHETIHELQRDSKKRWFRTVYSPLSAEQNPPDQIVVLVEDISERREAETQLRYHANLLSNISDAVISSDPSLKIQSWNHAAEKIYGYTAEEAIGNNVFELLKTEISPDARDAALDCFRKNTKWEGEIVEYCKNGKHLNIDSSVSPINDQDGELIGAVAVNRDITETKQLKSQLALADRMASIGLLAAGVAHEINNPLTYALYNLSDLRDDLPRILLGSRAEERASQVAEQLDAALEGITSVGQIVRDLRTFSHADDKELTEVSLNDVINGALNMANCEFKYRAVLVKELADDLPKMMINQGRLAQVVLNLLVNAAHAIPEGHVNDNRIAVRSWITDQQICFSVADTGCGIVSENLSRLFDPFFTTKAPGQGSGLGLPICHNIISSMGGVIAVESEEDRSTTFTVKLPQSSLSTCSPAPKRNGALKPAEAAPTPRGRVLIIDDEPNIGKALRRIVNTAHDVEVLHSGAEAKKRLAENLNFHAIVCDVMMPDISGIDLYYWLQDNHPEILDRIIFISGGLFTPNAQQFFREIKNPRLEKPFSPPKLKSLIDKLVEKYQDDD